MIRIPCSLAPWRRVVLPSFSFSSSIRSFHTTAYPAHAATPTTSSTGTGTGTSTVSPSTPGHSPETWKMPDPIPGVMELHYFALRGRAEQIRLLLQETQLPYVDRLLTQWQLRKLKATGSPISNPTYQQAQDASPLPFGGLPMMREGDLILAQTPAILQYIAQRGGDEFYPSDPVENARAQMIIAGTEDLFQNYWPIKLDQNRYVFHSGSFPVTPGNNTDFVQFPSTYLPQPFSNYTVPRGFRRETLPRWLTFFESLLKKNPKGTDYLIGTSRTYADIVLFAHLNAILTIEPECLTAFPHLAAHYQRIAQRPHIATYLKKRPNSGL